MATAPPKAPQKASWMKTGDVGLAQSQKVAEERAKSFGPPRFFISPPNPTEGKKLILCDSDGVFYYEHNLRDPKTGRWGVTRTCRSEIDTCPICESGDSPSYVCAHTIIDTSKYTDKRGREHYMEKKLLVSKQTVQNTLAKYRKKKGTLKFSLIEFTRSKDTEASTGETIIWEKTLTEAQLRTIFTKANVKGTSFEDWIKPFDYNEVLAPRSIEELEKLVNMAKPVGRDGGDDESVTEDAEVPDESLDDLL